jgi:hypothetical protein
MTSLIDTDWVIDHLHQSERVTRRLEALALAGLALSIIRSNVLCTKFFGIRPSMASAHYILLFCLPTTFSGRGQ